ncbi:LBP_cg2779 family protein [Lactobacillus delbrueckii subsp. bulgaricus]
MKPEELSDAIIEFQSKHAVSDTTLAFASHLSVEKVHAMKQGRGNFTSDEINQMLDYLQSYRQS